ncbi:MAG: hypothetical protein KFH98_14130 [Gemmatimonadetes bacterium]|nr:hypothetical protein [Gemmatimonadota bacterium]
MTNDFLNDIIDREERFERRVRYAAQVAWCVTFALLPLIGIALFLIETGGGMMVDLMRTVLMVLGMAGILSLFAAVLTTVGWLFRSRAPTLAAIDQRLALLENILLSRQ